MDERNIFDVSPEMFPNERAMMRPRMFLVAAVFIAFIALAAFAG